MKFQLTFDINQSPKLVEHQQKILLMGSCFTENIGEKLRKHKFSLLENPNGILFNPISVSKALEGYMENRKLTADDLFLFNDAWHSWEHHSRFSAIDPDVCLQKINDATTEAHFFMKGASQLMVTLGSAWVYTFTEKAVKAIPGEVAANNHQAPADWFVKKLMSSEEVFVLLDSLMEKLTRFNPSLQVIFTISPVRHIREGVIGNNRSKAVLIQSVHQVSEKWESAYYFPAYELVMDDLRDYRFFAEDMVHPNYQATQYVWEKFTEACMNEETRLLMKEVADINLAYQHRPQHPETQRHKAFLQLYLERTQKLQLKFPFLDLGKELIYFSK